MNITWKKNILFLLICAFILVLYCSDNENDSEPNELGGDTDIPMGQVGNVVSLGSIHIDDMTISIPIEGEIIKNEAGIATLNVKININDIKNHSLYEEYNSLLNLDELVERIPQEYLDSAGNIDGEVKVKITSEGLQDYVNRDSKAHTLIKYDGEVGDEYNITKSNGHELKRKITQKSTQDDFPYGFYYIKTTTVEQPSAYPGVNKFIYKFNHRFGAVHVEAVLDDGSSVSSYIYSQNNVSAK